MPFVMERTGRVSGTFGKNVFRKPVYAKAADAANQDIRALHGLFQLLDLIKLKSLGERTI